MRIRLLVATLGTALLISQAQADDSHFHRQLSVHGEAERQLAPDRAEVQLSIEARAADTATAMNEAGRKVQALHDALRNRLKPEQIRSTDLQLRAVVRGTLRSWRRDSSEPMEMLASRQLTLQDIALNQLPELMNTLARQPLASIGQVRTLVANARAHQDELMLLAIDDARKRAQAMARRLGMQLGPPLSVHPQEDGPRPRPVFAARQLKMAEVDMAGAGMDQAGQQTLTARVQITFELELP